MGNENLKCIVLMSLNKKKKVWQMVEMETFLIV